MLELLSKRSEERYLNSYTRTCFVGESEDDEEDDSPLMELERFDDSWSPWSKNSFISTNWHCHVQWMSRSAEPCGENSHRGQGLQSGDCTVLKAGRAPPELIEAARLVRCQAQAKAT